MKKFLAVVLMLALFVTLGVGCAQQAAPAAAPAATPAADTVKIGVCIANFDDTFLVNMMDGMKKSAADYKDAKVDFVDAKEDAAQQLSQVENFITQGVKAIVVVPVNTEATAPITEACAKAKVKLVYVNRLPANLPADVSFVGSDSIQAGILQMEYIGEKLGGKGNIVIMQGKLDNEAAVQRTAGVNKVIKEKYPNMKILATQTANWSRAEAMTLMENWLSKGDTINAVCANNDDMALGAIGALQAANKLSTTIVGGTDCTQDAVQAVKAGTLAVTVFQDAAGQGKGGIDTAYKAAKGETVDHQVMIPFQLVTKDNVAQFEKK